MVKSNNKRLKMISRKRSSRSIYIFIYLKKNYYLNQLIITNNVNIYTYQLPVLVLFFLDFLDWVVYTITR